MSSSSYKEKVLFLIRRYEKADLKKLPEEVHMDINKSFAYKISGIKSQEEIQLRRTNEEEARLKGEKQRALPAFFFFYMALNLIFLPFLCRVEGVLLSFFSSSLSSSLPMNELLKVLGFPFDRLSWLNFLLMVGFRLLSDFLFLSFQSSLRTAPLGVMKFHIQTLLPRLSK